MAKTKVIVILISIIYASIQSMQFERLPLEIKTRILVNSLKTTNTLAQALKLLKVLMATGSSLCNDIALSPMVNSAIINTLAKQYCSNNLIETAVILATPGAEKFLFDYTQQYPFCLKTDGHLLVKAVKNGNKKGMKILLTLQVPIDSQDYAGDTALIVACSQNDIPLVQQLLADNANPNIRNNNLDSALIVAAWQNKLDMVKILLVARADVNITDVSRNTPLIHACSQGHYAMAKILLDADAHIDQQNVIKCTALMCAISKTHNDIVELLLERNASLSLRDHFDKNAYDKAYAHENWQALELLKAYSQKNN